jgi:hypothetical protein
VEFARIKECVWARQMVAEPTGFTLSPASSRRIRTWRRERAPCPLRETAARNFVNGTGAEADAVRRERPEPAP